jgi:hypothetical protein
MDDPVEVGSAFIAEHRQAHAVIGEPGVDRTVAGVIAGMVEDPAPAAGGADEPTVA